MHTVEEKLGEARILWFFGTQNWAPEVTHFSSRSTKVYGQNGQWMAQAGPEMAQDRPNKIGLGWPSMPKMALRWTEKRSTPSQETERITDSNSNKQRLLLGSFHLCLTCTRDCELLSS